MEPGGLGALIVVLEGIVDHAADVLEGAGVDLDRLSDEIFGAKGTDPGWYSVRKDADQMRLVMSKIGRHVDLTFSAI